MSTSHVLAVAGRVLVPEDAGPDAVVTVKLVDASGEVLAATSVDGTTGPVEFALHADPGDVPDPSRLLLWARLRSAVGLWGTTELVPVGDDPPQIAVTRVDA